MKALLAGAAALALLSAAASPALAQYTTDAGPNSNWQFPSAAEKSIRQGNVILMQQKQNDYWKRFKDGASGAYGSSGSAAGEDGLLGGSAGMSGGQVLVQQVITCSASGGANLNCTGGGLSTDATVTTTGNTMSSTNTITGNTVTSTGNTSNNADVINNQD